MKQLMLEKQQNQDLKDEKKAMDEVLKEQEQQM